MDAPICKLCGSGVKELMCQERDNRVYHIVNCPTCALIQTAEHYSELSPDYADLDASAMDEGHIWCQGVHKIPAFVQWHAEASRLSTERSPKLLDVGCGTGGFLNFASERGFCAYGFDASSAQAEYASQHFANVRHASSLQAYLEILDQPDLKFDFITLWDVFEHIRNPVPFLQQLSQGLKPGGHLFVSVPNGQAIPWKIPIYRALNRPLDFAPWEHVFYHSIKSLHKCLENASLEPIRSGAVACYPRPLSCFELCRRAGFRLLKVAPTTAPQIFAWARSPPSR